MDRQATHNQFVYYRVHSPIQRHAYTHTAHAHNCDNNSVPTNTQAPPSAQVCGHQCYIHTQFKVIPELFTRLNIVAVTLPFPDISLTRLCAIC